MGKSVKISKLLLVFWLIATGAAAQEGFGADMAPETLRRPERGEAPRYPKDLVIGELGQGETSEGVYLLAQNIISAVIAGRRDAPALAGSAYSLTESAFEEIRSIRPRYYRLGGGRTEVDGCVSFLLRIIGSDLSITGELFLRQAETADLEDSGAPSEGAARSSQGTGRWLFDDLILEEKRALSELRDTYRYDFSPYERFY